MDSSQPGDDFSKMILRFFHILQLITTLKSQQFSHSNLRQFCDFFDCVSECMKKVDAAQRISLDNFIFSLRALFPLLDESFFNSKTLENGAGFLEEIIEDHIGLQHTLASTSKSTSDRTACAPFFLDCLSPVLKLKNLPKAGAAEFLDCWFLLDPTSMLFFCLEQLQFGDPSISDRVISWLDVASSKNAEILNCPTKSKNGF
uniref:Uncharacterized protein n=2 Tax=Schistocephalus solidus TaxID=70667 RepID=A0A0X3PT61_SCHSO